MRREGRANEYAGRAVSARARAAWKRGQAQRKLSTLPSSLRNAEARASKRAVWEVRTPMPPIPIPIPMPYDILNRRCCCLQAG